MRLLTTVQPCYQIYEHDNGTCFIFNTDTNEYNKDARGVIYYDRATAISVAQASALREHGIDYFAPADYSDDEETAL